MKYIFPVIILLLFILCIFIDKTLMRGITMSGHFMAILAISLVALGLIFDGWHKKQPVLKVSGMDVWLGAFFAIAVLSSVMAGILPWWNQRLVMEAYLLVLYFTCSRACSLAWGKGGRPTSFKPLLLIFAGLFIAALIQTAYGYLQYAGALPSFNDSFPITGSFLNPSAYASYLISVVPLAFGAWVYRKTLSFPPWVSWLALGVFVASVSILPFTLSRASWLGAMAGIGLILVFRYKLIRQIKQWHQKSPYLSWGAIVITLICVVFSAKGIYELKPGSVQGRLLVWELSLEMIGEAPLLGHGTGRFGAAYNDYQAKYFETQGTHSTYAWLAKKGIFAFNEFLEIAAERGLIALGLFIGLLVSAWRHTLKRHKEDTPQAVLCIISLGSIMAVLVYGQFAYPFSTLPTYLNFFLCLSFIAATTLSRPVRAWTVPPLLQKAIVIITGLVVAFGLYFHFHQYQAYRQWKQADQIKELPAKLAAYKKLYPWLKGDGMFLLFYGEYLSDAQMPRKSNRVLNESHQYTNDPYLYITKGANYARLGQYRQAEEAYRHAAYMVPVMFYPKYHLARFYLQTGQNGKAAVVLKQIINKKEKVPSKATRQFKQWAKKMLE